MFHPYGQLLDSKKKYLAGKFHPAGSVHVDINKHNINNNTPYTSASALPTKNTEVHQHKYWTSTRSCSPSVMGKHRVHTRDNGWTNYCCCGEYTRRHTESVGDIRYSSGRQSH